MLQKHRSCFAIKPNTKGLQTLGATLLLTAVGAYGAMSLEAPHPVSSIPSSGAPSGVIDSGPAETNWQWPCLKIPQLSAAPKFDGAVDQNLWTSADVLPISFPMDTIQPVPADASFQMGYCEEILYILVRFDWSHDKAPPVSRASTRGGNIWADDGVELFFARADDLTNVRQFLFNLAGTQGSLAIDYDIVQSIPKSSDTSWNPDWKVKCWKNGNVWTALAAVPASAFGIQGQVGEVFRFNIVRNRVANPNPIIRWAPLPKGAANCMPSHFGFAVLTGPEAKTFSWEQLASNSLTGILFVDGPRSHTLVSGMPVSVMMQLPLAGNIPGATPQDVHVCVKDVKGSEILSRDFIIDRWPHRLSVRPGSMADGTYTLEISRGKGRTVLSRIGMCWQPQMLVGAENAAACRIDGPGRVEIYPRSVGRKVVFLREKGRLTATGYGRAAYLRLPIMFQSPGPFYGNLLSAKLRYRIDQRPWQDLALFTASEETALAEDLPPGEHAIEVESMGRLCAVSGFRFAANPLTAVSGAITTEEYSELLTDVRIDVFKEGSLVRTEYVRSPHNSRFTLVGLEAGRYRMRCVASGWNPLEIEGVILEKDGSKIDLGILALTRDPACAAGFDPMGIGYGRSVNVTPGASFTAPIGLWKDNSVKAQLVSRFKVVDLKIEESHKTGIGRWNPIGNATFRVPDGTPFDMYDLKLIYGGTRGEWPYVLGQAVCVREQLPSHFYVAGCGHMNTWGQQTSEYLARVADMAQLAGARTLLIANEVNAAYVCGALRNLRIPYAVTTGNHTLSRWEDFFGPRSRACDDGPMRIVTFGDLPHGSWREAAALIAARPEATNRILLCFEGFAPIDLIRDGKVNLLFDGHSDDAHPDLPAFPKGTLQFRAPSQESLRWIAMTPGGLDSSISTPQDVPVLSIPRNQPAPLRVEYSGTHDGSCSELTACLINEFKIPFPQARLRFVLQKGKYTIAGGKVAQTFDSDDGCFTILDIEAAIGPQQTTAVTAKPQT